MITHGSRAVGIASSNSLLKLTPRVVDLVSTTGLAPVIVTVSASVDIQLGVDLDVSARLDDDAFAHHLGEAGQLEGEGRSRSAAAET